MKNILYVTYDGINDPLGQSQVLAYLNPLSKKFNILIISFEKKKYLKKKNNLNQNIKNIQIPFRKNFIGKLYGICYLNYLVIKHYILGFRLIHFRGFIPTASLFFFIFLIRPNFIYDFRSFTVLELEEMKKLNIKFFIKLMHKIDNFLISQATEIVVLTKSVKDYFTNKFLKENIHVIPTCCPKNNHSKDKENEFIELVYLGGINDPYLLDESLQFFKYFQILKNKARLNIVTQGDHNKIKELVNKNKISPSLINIQFIEQKNIFRFLSKMNLAIFFIKKTKSRYHCCPTKIGEFLSSGLPIISNPGIYISEKIAKKYESIYLCDYEDININSVRKILNQISKFDKIKSLSAHYENFNIEMGIKKYLQIYNKIL